MLNEFKEFALRGNVMDMAVGIIIGAAFSTIVRSLVDDIIMPPIGVVTGGVDFSSIFIALNGQHYDSLAAARQAGAPTMNIGLFINNVISFVIVAFVLFMAIKAMNQLRRKQEEDPASEPPPSREVAATDGNTGRPGETGLARPARKPSGRNDFARLVRLAARPLRVERYLKKISIISGEME